MSEVTRYPQVPAMTEAEIDQLLAEPRIARLSTINPDGTPHTLPIWYEWRDGEVLVSTQTIQRKVRNMQRDRRVTVLIDSDQMPYRGVMIYGEALLDTNDAASKRVTIFERYFGDRTAAEDYARQMADKWEPVLVRIRPTKIVSFDYSKGSLVPQDA
jgi:PPOX class probable F420-dependent enzyme